MKLTDEQQRIIQENQGRRFRVISYDFEAHAWRTIREYVTWLQGHAMLLEKPWRSVVLMTWRPAPYKRREND